jgi:hypothetical protein
LKTFLAADCCLIVLYNCWCKFGGAVSGSGSRKRLHTKSSSLESRIRLDTRDILAHSKTSRNDSVCTIALRDRRSNVATAFVVGTAFPVACGRPLLICPAAAARSLARLRVRCARLRNDRRLILCYTKGSDGNPRRGIFVFVRVDMSLAERQPHSVFGAAAAVHILACHRLLRTQVGAAK